MLGVIVLTRENEIERERPGWKGHSLAAGDEGGAAKEEEVFDLANAALQADALGALGDASEPPG